MRRQKRNPWSHFHFAAEGEVAWQLLSILSPWPHLETSHVNWDILLCFPPWLSSSVIYGSFPTATWTASQCSASYTATTSEDAVTFLKKEGWILACLISAPYLYTHYSQESFRSDHQLNIIWSIISSYALYFRLGAEPITQLKQRFFLVWVVPGIELTSCAAPLSYNLSPEIHFVDPVNLLLSVKSKSPVSLLRIFNMSSVGTVTFSKEEH